MIAFVLWGMMVGMMLASQPNVPLIEYIECKIDQNDKLVCKTIRGKYGTR